jgi:hypothetical protein
MKKKLFLESFESSAKELSSTSAQQAVAQKNATTREEY